MLMPQNALMASYILAAFGQNPLRSVKLWRQLVIYQLRHPVVALLCQVQPIAEPFLALGGSQAHVGDQLVCRGAECQLDLQTSILASGITSFRRPCPPRSTSRMFGCFEQCSRMRTLRCCLCFSNSTNIGLLGESDTEFSMHVMANALAPVLLMACGAVFAGQASKTLKSFHPFPNNLRGTFPQGPRRWVRSWPSIRRR